MNNINDINNTSDQDKGCASKLYVPCLNLKIFLPTRLYLKIDILKNNFYNEFF